MSQPIYLDNHATTPVDPRVFEAMRPFLQESYGNASSRSHAFGWKAEEAVETARGQVAGLLGAEPREIVFTSGATESNNLALKGIADGREGHMVSSRIEHPAVIDSLEWMERRGIDVTWLPVGPTGRIDPADVAAALTDHTLLVSVMLANNEVGTIQPIREIGRLCETHGVLLHTDATQGVGKIPFDVSEDHVHLASLTAHKIYGPQGAGALYVRRRDPEVRLARQMHGGSQERGMRAGTLNVPGIVGLGMACELCRKEREEQAAHEGALRDRLREQLCAGLDGVTLNGDPEHRLPGNLHVSFAGVDSQTLMLAVPEVAVSAGSACSSGAVEPSRVLRALGINARRAAGAIRFGIGRFTTAEEIDNTAGLFVAAVKKLRGRNP